MDDDNDFTFCQVGQTADKEHSEAQVALLNINDIRIKDDFSNGGGDSQIDTLLWKDKPLDNVSIKKQETVGSLSFNVIDMSTPKIDLPKQTTTVPSEDSGKNSQEKMTSTRKPAVRAKVPFEKGYSQMDWLKLTRTHPDLAGLNGQSNRRLISIDEVKQHRTGDSIWTVLKGHVYNIAPYMKFHPGGVDMLMKAAGKDCTSLFNKYHAWVNAEFMLEKCLVGTLDESR